MSTITSLNNGDTGAVSRTVINTNFTNLNTDKAELASPVFTGTPSLPTGTTAVTQSAGDNSTKVATTAYVDSTSFASFADTEVWTGIPPSAWTDLDLSSVVGATQRMVLLRIYNADAADRNFTFRPNGDTNEYQDTTNAAQGGVYGALVNAGDNGTVLVKTDTAGVVEWRAGSTGTTGSTIDVLAYW